MSLTKKYLKNKPACKITFELPKEAAENAERVELVGDFNEWKAGVNPLIKDKNGNFSVTVELVAGQDYQFRYLIDGHIWINDWDADRYEFNPAGNCENSVVALS